MDDEQFKLLDLRQRRPEEEYRWINPTVKAMCRWIDKNNRERGFYNMVPSAAREQFRNWTNSHQFEQAAKQIVYETTGYVWEDWVERMKKEPRS